MILKKAAIVFGAFALNLMLHLDGFSQNVVFERTSAGTDKLLDSSVAAGGAIVWHLYHSGFALKTARHFLIFDYWPGQSTPRGKGLASGFIDPDEIKDRDVTVLISHEHDDHFWPDCIDWQEKVGNIRFIVVPEVAQKDGRFAATPNLITVLAPGQTDCFNGVEVKTTKANDSGVAFFVKVDGLAIYHSGDHAAWNWGNNPAIETGFLQGPRKLLAVERIDIAMQVADPRLKTAGWGGAPAFAQEFQPKLLIPIHSKGNYAAFAQLESKMRQMPVAFWPVRRPGDCILFNLAQKEEL